jgi:hypothetical protein
MATNSTLPRKGSRKIENEEETHPVCINNRKPRVKEFLWQLTKA